MLLFNKIKYKKIKQNHHIEAEQAKPQKKMNPPRKDTGIRDPFIHI